MVYMDLNIPFPYKESDDRRLKLCIKAMELGYTGVTYNRTLKGVMSESNRCEIQLFPISKLIPTSSAFFSSVEFRRSLLNVSLSAPFRQYTRLTVVVDATAQASALNLGNPVLRTYDVVAVRPLNQNVFDQACLTCEVDLIAIDFEHKLPFRLKQNMVKAAIKRGVYFEVTYSGLIADVESRREIITNCKLLVDWTRGKNLIFASAASSATELRGPQDVVNLVSLLGLSVERATAAISKNCRALLANALRKKNFYKEAVKVEAIPSVEKNDSDKSAFEEWLKWDPISSGEGDLLLGDMKNAFSMSKTTPKPKKPIDFISAMNGLPAHGLQIKDLILDNNVFPLPPQMDSDSCANMETDDSIKGHETPKEPDEDDYMPEKVEDITKNDCSFDASSNGNIPLPESHQISLNGSNSINEASDCSTIQYISVQTGACTISGEAIVSSSNKAAEAHLQDTELQRAGENALPGEQVLLAIANGEDMQTEKDIAVDEIADKIERVEEREILVTSNETIDNVYLEGGQQKEIPFEEFLYIKAKIKETISEDMLSACKQAESITSYIDHMKLPKERERRKRNQRHRPLLFPFKRLLSPSPLKKRKSRK